MTEEIPKTFKLPKPQLSGVMVAGNVHAAIAKAMDAAKLKHEPLLQWTADPITGTVTIAKARGVK
jgi:hypothetical protein